MRGGGRRQSPGVDLYAILPYIFHALTKLLFDRIDRSQSSAKIRVDNLHYDLTEDDLRVNTAMSVSQYPY